MNKSNSKFWLDPQYHEKTGEIFKPDQLENHMDERHKPDNQPSSILERIKGSIYGLALGDSLGAAVEFRPHEYMESNKVTDMQGGGTWGLNAGQFTDDTSMALCLANSLIDKQDFDPYDQLVRYKWWYRHGYMSSTGICFDIGAATRESIEEFERKQRDYCELNKIPIDEMDKLKATARHEFNVECSRPGVAGNGALMRLCPVPLFFHEKPEVAVEYSGLSGLITHGDKKSVDACRYYGALIVAALKGETREQLTDKQFYQKHKEWFGDKPLSEEVLQIAQGSYQNEKGYEGGILGRGYVINTLEAALWAFWSDKNSFREGALNAVNLGDDTDTTAAIYGQLAGAYYGFSELPSEWVQILYARKFIDYVSNWIFYEGNEWFKKRDKYPMDTSRERTPSEDRPIETLYNSRTTQDSFDQGYSGLTSSISPKTYLERHAIGTTAGIGHFYNASRDMFVNSAEIRLRQYTTTQTTNNFEVLNGDHFRSKNPLQHLDIDPQLSLSIMSGLVEKKGIAAILDYPHLYNANTYGFYYSFRTDQESDVKIETENFNNLIYGSTHVVTGIRKGIDVVVLLTSDQQHSDFIVTFLNNLCISLKNAKELPREIHKLDEILNVHTYSNITSLNGQMKMSRACEQIQDIVRNQNLHQPCQYILHPINYFYPSLKSVEFQYISIQRQILVILEKYFNFKSMYEKKKKECHEISRTYSQDFIDNHHKIEDRLNNIFEKYFKDANNICEMIVQVRCGKQSASCFEIDLLNEKTMNSLRNEIDDLVREIVLLKRNLQFIENLRTKHFEYWRAELHNISRNDTIESIVSKLSKFSDKNFLLSNDELNRLFSVDLHRIMSKMEQNYQQNRVSLVYIDFSYSSFELDAINTVPREEAMPSIKDKKYPSTPSIHMSNPMGARSDNTPNLLLVGAEKSGKSMLINILNNSELTKPTSYGQYLSNRPNILIPFQLSVYSDEYNTHSIICGKADQNDRFSSSLGPTTQRCKAYIVNLSSTMTIRIIDTPGFSTTSEQQQDRLIEDIRTTVLDLSSLKAIAIAIRANDQQLGGYSSFIRKIMNIYGPEIQSKFIFFITDYFNGQPYKLKRDSIPEFIRRIEKFLSLTITQTTSNVILFDSQYFYKQAHSLSSLNQDLYEQSITISYDGIEALKKVLSCNDQDQIGDNESTKEYFAKLQIEKLVRPILESIRNNHRNIILLSKRPEASLIELNPIELNRSSMVCFGCHRPVKQYSAFWIFEDRLNDYYQPGLYCQCSPGSQERVHYELRYRLAERSYFDQDKLVSENQRLFRLMIHFGRFLKQGRCSSQPDLFIQKLNRMITEETLICENQYYSFYNHELFEILVHLRANYLKEVDGDGTNLQIQAYDYRLIQNYIREAKGIETVRKQWEASSILK